MKIRPTKDKCNIGDFAPTLSGDPDYDHIKHAVYDREALCQPIRAGAAYENAEPFKTFVFRRAKFQLKEGVFDHLWERIQ